MTTSAFEHDADEPAIGSGADEDSWRLDDEAIDEDDALDAERFWTQGDDESVL